MGQFGPTKHTDMKLWFKLLYPHVASKNRSYQLDGNLVT